ncbi:hypothetical protein [Streptomyces zaomyceticus]|uniref:Uncharacterized protein n=1 Tax=Streptomyces zaomyceticus TaxID=68286 RepID=A0ABZ1L3Q2_9ACTN
MSRPHRTALPPATPVAPAPPYRRRATEHPCTATESARSGSPGADNPL